MDLSVVSLHDAVALVKLYLRELPEPLLTFDLYDPLLTAYGNCNALLPFVFGNLLISSIIYRNLRSKK